MIRYRFAGAVLLSVLWLVNVALSQDRKEELAQLAERVDKHYNRLQSMRAEFVEIYSGAGMSRTESGTLWLKKPGQMRWVYVQPRKKLFVSDGKRAWFYVPGEQQVRKASISKLDDLRSPLRFLLGKTKLLKELKNLGFATEAKPLVPGNQILRGAPNGMEDRVSMVTLEVTSQGRIDRILIEEIDGSTTDFRFSNEVENLKMAQGLFKFEPPAGVEIVEAKDLGN